MNLSQIKGPEEIRSLTYEECEELADDIRAQIIQTVSHNGGHLSSNLGAVEITLALHRVFDTPKDKLIFDVGHQSYAHKLITGRYSSFDTIRTYGGLSGFPKRDESIYDCFETGHASTAISAAVGFARARDLLGEKHHVVAVVGDGAFTGGMCYEALNDCGSRKTRLIIILNDNEMSITQNVGGLNNHFSMLRSSAGWNNTKKRVRIHLSKVPLIGKPMYHALHRTKQMIKGLFWDEGFFSSIGIRYLGPINGNDLPTLEKLLKQARELDEPVLIHCVTKKGFGYSSAERNPTEFHGISPFFVDVGENASSLTHNCGNAAAEELVSLAQNDSKIVAVTAAMATGTSAAVFGKAFPDRLFDVGIAEEHAVTMCAGFAAAGMRPFFFVYSTFLQRGYDQVLHDVCLQNLPVVFLIDRSGLAHDDGQTHQGIYDLSYLSHIPNMTLFSPASCAELREAIRAAYQLGTPCAIRYPKSEYLLPEGYCIPTFSKGKWQKLCNGRDAAILAVGSMLPQALLSAASLQKAGISCAVYNASTIKPLDDSTLQNLLSDTPVVVTLEEHALCGGFGSLVLTYAQRFGKADRIRCIGIPDVIVPQGDRKHLLNDLKLDEPSITEFIRKEVLHER